MSNCLLIFTRNPELGKVKSRLAKGVGKENALTIYKKLLQHTREVVTQVDCDRWEEAFAALDTQETVIGPAKDGGYYLLGMKSLIPEVFSNKEWGTETVYETTLANLNKEKLHTLEELNDIDFAEDLKPYPEFEQYL